MHETDRYPGLSTISHVSHDFSRMFDGETPASRLTIHGQLTKCGLIEESNSCFVKRAKVSITWNPTCPTYLRGISKMPLINLVFALIVVGVGLWLINRYIPMASSIKTILNIVVVVAVGVWVLQVTGLWGPISSYRVSR